MRRILNANVEVTMNGYAIMGIATVSLYGMYALIRDLIIAFS